MKYKAIATIVLLLLPFVPLAVANQPAWNVEFRVRPGHTKYYGPCVVSTEFPVDVYLWNDKSLSAVGVYAYDFYFFWKNNAGISLDSFANHIPWPSGSYFLVINETGTFVPDPTWDFYHLAVTAIGNSTINPSLELGATGVFNASLVTLTFHIDEEPCWPFVFSSHFLVGNELGGDDFTPWDDPVYFPHVSTGCGQVITNIEIDQGDYTLESSQPNIDPLVPENDPGYVDDHTFMEDSIGETHTIIIALSNITGAYGFKFTLHWEPEWYNTTIQHVTILPAFAPPYELLTMDMDNVTGTLTVELKRPCEKLGLHAAGFTPVVSVSFVTSNMPMIGEVPVATNTTFWLTGSRLYAKCPDLVTYTQGTGTGSTTLWYSGPIIQMFVPKSEADITIDGVVDVEDIAALAAEYGNLHPWTALASPDDPLVDPVDIFDLVYVAKRYGDP